MGSLSKGWHAEIITPEGSVFSEHVPQFIGAVEALRFNLTRSWGESAFVYLDNKAVIDRHLDDIRLAALSDARAAVGFHLTLASADEQCGPFMLWASRVNGFCWDCNRRAASIRTSEFNINTGVLAGPR